MKNYISSKPQEYLKYVGSLKSSVPFILTADIDRAFDDFMATDPDEETFCQVMSKVTLTPHMFYRALKG